MNQPDAPTDPQPKPLAEAREDREWPAELTPSLTELLGLMLWDTGPIAHAFQNVGRAIPRRAEDEQAFVLHWLIGLYLEHGDDWRRHAGAQLGELRQQKEAANG